MLKSICTNSFIVTNAFQLIVVLPDLKDDQLSQIIKEIEMIVGKEKKCSLELGGKRVFNK